VPNEQKQQQQQNITSWYDQHNSATWYGLPDKTVKQWEGAAKKLCVSPEHLCVHKQTLRRSFEQVILAQQWHVPRMQVCCTVKSCELQQ
jgi:hypothetical protein